MVQWLGISLPVQGSQVRALVREDSHMLWNNWAREPQLLSPRATTTEARTPRARAPHQERPPQ